MSFADAIKTCLAKYADFSGRARRSEYWFFTLGVILAYIVCFIVTVIVKPLGILLLVVLVLGAIIPGLAVGVRRLHDTARSGWWLLLSIVPFGSLVVLVFQCLDSGPDNQYGPNPKGGAIGYGAPPAAPAV